MQRYALTTVPAPAAVQFPAHSLQISITPDGYGIAKILEKKLKDLGYRAQVTEQLTGCDMAIVLDALRTFTSEDEAIEINHKVFSHARSIAPYFSQHGGVFITVQNTGGEFGLNSLERAAYVNMASSEYNHYTSGLTGLIKTAAQEWPKARCKAIDLECGDHTPDQLAEKLLNEIFVEDNQLECGLPANEKRITLQLAPVNESCTFPFKHNSNSVIVVTGGARGVTAACLIALAKKIKTRFVLLGRTALEEEPVLLHASQSESELKQILFTHYSSQKISKTPKQIQTEVNKIIANRETKNTINTLTALEQEVLYFSVDIQNKLELERVLNQVRKQWGKITGFVHGAGVLADKLIAQKTEEQFRHVFNTKVIGLKNFLELTRIDPLTHIILFSSVAGRYGNIGQADYAMANEVLNKAAQHEQRIRGNACLVKSINWGPWESGMVTPELRAMFKARGIPILSMKEGTELFVHEFQHHTQVEIIAGDSLQKPAVCHPESAACSKVLFAQSDNANAEYDTTIAQHFTIDGISHLFLYHHSINGSPVLPACLVADWFLQTARKRFAHTNALALQNFRVMKGIRLENFSHQSYSFTVEINQNLLTLKTNHSLPLDSKNLSGSRGQAAGRRDTPHYSAELVQAVSSGALEIPSASSPWPWDKDEIYNNKLLFHGPDFSVIESLEHVSDHGGSAFINNSDFRAADGVLQLAILWGVRMLGKTSLPTHIQYLSWNNDSKLQGKLYCQFRAELKDNHHFHVDALLRNENGEIVLTLRGLNMYVISAKAIA